MSEKQIKETKEFLRGLESTQENVKRLVQVQIDEFNNSSVPSLKNRSK